MQVAKQGSVGMVWLWISIFISVVLPMMLGFVAVELFTDWRWSNYPLHAMVESVGAVSALIIATLMIIMLRKGRLARHYILVVCALIGMGLMDGFHSVLHVGVSFVWLHSIATMVGGVMFAAVWLPESLLTDARQRILLFTTIAVSLFLGIASIALPEMLPVMVIEGEFSLLAKIINFTGGIGFLVGASYFVYDYLRMDKDKAAERKFSEDVVFANHCFLFGVAGLLFETSVLWDAGWWLWHILRLLAYFIVLVYFFDLFRKTQNELVEGEEKFRLINSRVPGIVYQFKVDKNGNRSLPYVSPTIEHYLGLSAETVMDDVEKWIDLTYPDDRSSLESSIVSSMENMEVWEWEGRFVRNDNNVLWLHGSSTPFKQQDGSIVWDGVFVDITARKRVEDELLEASILNDKIINESPIGISIYDPSGQCIAANSSIAEMVGATREQILSQNYQNIESWKIAGLLEAANESIRLQKKERNEFEILTTFSKYAIFDCLFMPFKLRDEQHLLFMIDDVSERKENERSVQLQSTIIDQIHDSVISTDLDGFIISWNKGSEKLFGYGSEEVLGKHITVAYPEEEHAFLKNEIIAPLKDKGEHEVEVRMIRKSGKKFYAHLSLSMLYDEKGKANGMVGSSMDINERKLAELKLEEYRGDLESLVVERTTELRNAHEELVRKERLATLGQLTATVSHELRNPLGAMKPSLYIIGKKSDKNDERLQQAIERVDRNINRCDRIIDELLDFTRITDLEQRNTHVDEWLQLVINEQDIHKDIQIEKDLSLNDVESFIDSDRMRRAVINILENACHAMMDDAQQVLDKENSRLGIKSQINAERIEIIISDTGSGIPEDVLEKIFEPLFSTKGFGVGLGMPTVKQIMEQHGGGVEVDSEEGKGTSVILWLPLDIDEGATT